MCSSHKVAASCFALSKLFCISSRLGEMSPVIQIEVREGLVSCLQHHLLQRATFRHAEQTLL